MKGDFSRLTFDPARHYASVLTQQGRVAVDADWNEQQAIAHYLRTTAIADLAGAAAAPQDAAGFAVTAAGADLHLGAGRIYVGGELCVNEADVPIAQQPDLPAGAELYQTAPGTFTPNPPNGRYLIYLDVWARHLTALEDPQLKDSALGGADTATRLKTVWQARGLRVGAPGSNVSCAGPIPGWSTLIAPPTGTLAARARAAANQTNLCIMPETAGYRRLENQLYRIEVHDGGATGAATFKWSRDNAAFVVRWLGNNGTELTVASVGRDAHTGFRNGQWVELLDEDHELTGTPGTMVRIATVRGTTLVLDPATATGPFDHASFGALAKVRAWDSAGLATVSVPGGNDGFLAIEDGLEVKFAAAASYVSGDHWLVPARTATGVEWPEVAGQPLALPRHGTSHRFARLALADLQSGVWTVVEDCRALFPPLTGLTTLDYLGGDGQEVTPNPLNPGQRVALPQPLRAGVSRGRTPVAGARVRFRVTAGDGRLTGGGLVFVAVTGADGRVACDWSLDAQTPQQQVVAEWLDSADTPQHLPLTYAASLSRAAAVSFDPANTPTLGGENTVQGAIEALAGLSRTGCATYVVPPGSDWLALIKALKPGEDAHLCFQRGDFPATDTALFSQLGHITLSGAGRGSRIVVNRRETALLFERCASVTIRDLEVSAPDGSAAIGHIPGRGGTITATRCPEVDIADVGVRCGAGNKAQRTCITLRGADRSAPAASMRSARILRNRLTVGYGQDGILVTDCLNMLIEGNEIAVAPRPKTLSLDKLLEDRTRRNAMAKLLVDRPVRDPSAATGSTKTIKGGQFTTSFSSTVPQSEWDALVAAQPPGANDLRSVGRFDAYARKLIDAATSDASKLPTYSKQLDDLRATLGDTSFNRLQPQVKASLLVSDTPQTGTFDKLAAIKRTNALVVGTARILFDSPASNTDWNAILRTAPPPNVRNGGELVGYARKTAGRLLVDAGFRDRFPTVKGWFENVRQNLPATGRHAIVCGGARLGTVRVARNTAVAFEQGLHIGASSGGESRPSVKAGSVAAQENRFTVRPPFAGAYVPHAIFIGNADRIRLEANQVVRATATPFTTLVREAIRIWGLLGPFVQVLDNDLGGVGAGIRIRFEPVGKEPAKTMCQWLAADNLLRNTKPEFLLKAPDSVESRNNKLSDSS